MIDNRILIENDVTDDNLFLEGERDSLWYQIEKAKKQAFLINVLFAIICCGKIIISTVLLLISYIALTPLTLWVIFMLYYDIMYLFHLISAQLAIKKCSQEDLIYGQPDDAEVQDTNLQSFAIQQWILSIRPINPLKIQENAEKKFLCAFRLGEFCRLYYMILFLFGNVILSTQTITKIDNQDGNIQLMSSVFIGFGYIYLSIPLLLFALWPFISIYNFCVDIFRVFQTPSQQIKKSNFERLKVTQFKDITYLIEPECSICLYNYMPDDTILVMPCNNKHCFHQPCIKQWLEVNGNCPMCRITVESALEIEQP